jgi:membrane associated rhomboid family serine protease
MIPISTDAPIYHYPIATVSMIVINVIAFVVFCANANMSEVALKAPDGREFHNPFELQRALEEFEDRADAKEFADSLEIISASEPWMKTLSVEFGTFKPWQWLTNNFMHMGWMHLISNMIFLWAFGLIVEGKVGWMAFSSIYLVIGTLYGLFLQVSSWVVGWDGFALGASAAIFGLLAMCIAWAPANEFTLLWRFGMFDVTVLMYGFFFVAKELCVFIVAGFQMSSELLHMLGFAVGLPVGLWMVRTGYVDCEGWDLFSYLSGKTGTDSTVGQDKIREREKKANVKQEEAYRKANLLVDPVESAKKLQTQVEHAIAEGDLDLAIKIQNRISVSQPSVTWKQVDLFRVIQGMLKAKRFADAEPLMEQHIELFDDNRFSIQVLLIKIWLQDQRPRRSLRYMQGLNLAFFSPEQTQQIHQLAAHAKKQIAAGVIEIET